MKKKSLFALLLAAAFLFAVLGQLVAADDKAKAKPQSFCPPCGMKLENKNVFTDAGGYRFYGCSTYCCDKMKAEPEKYAQKIREKGEEPEKAPKTGAGAGKDAKEKSGGCASGCAGCPAGCGSKK